MFFIEISHAYILNIRLCNNLENHELLLMLVDFN